MRHSVNTELLQNVINYLSSRPYKEVNTILADLIKDVKILKEEISQLDQLESTNEQEEKI